MFKKILIANRGEIACRVMRTSQRLGVKTIAVYSDIDQNSKHTQLADEAFYLGGNKSAESYLNMEKILRIAKDNGAEAIHPGYGFLSENVEFVKLCEASGITFIGPPVKAINAMGSKIESKLIMQKSNVPIVPGYNGDNQEKDYLIEKAREIKYPIMIKADLGGGGKGMRIVRNENEFFEMLSSAQNEASKSFKSAKVLLEKYIENSKHIEVQVFGDHHGNYLHFYERDCTIQRRHQKVVEEAPSFLDNKTRYHLCDTAIQAAKAVGYTNAGTVEFIYDIDTNQFYFMEMNTRLQVEHPISEMITKQDFVELQLRVASGEKLPLAQDQVKIHGHSIECRVYSEDPMNNFLPGSGKLEYLREPNNWESEIIDEDVRVETGVRQGDEVSIFYDPMIAKLVTFAENRDLAIQKTLHALDEYKIYGLPTNLEFISRILKHPVYKKWDFDTNFIGKHQKDLFPDLKTTSQINKEDILEAIMSKELLARKAIAKNQEGPWSNLHSYRVNHNRTKTFTISEKKYTLEYLKNNNFNLYQENDVLYRNFSCSFCLENKKITITLPKDRIFSRLFHDVNPSTIVLLKEHGEQKKIVFEEDDYGIQENVVFGDTTIVKAPMSSTVSKIFVEKGKEVKKGESLVALEAMKMEHILKASQDGKIKSINYKVDSFVEEGEVIVEFEK